MEIKKRTILPKYSVFIVLVVFASACNITKFVPENDALFTGHELKIENKENDDKVDDITETDLKQLLRPRPNASVLGFRYKLALYNLAGTKDNFISKFLRKSGEPPVLLSQLNLDRNIQLLANTLENNGFFHADVNGDTTIEDKKAKATYIAEPGGQYTINEVTFPTDSNTISNEIQNIASQSFLKKGEAFDLDVIKNERIRIDAHLKERGYYFFNPEDLIILVDSTIGSTNTNLHVRFKPEVHTLSKQQYRINDVYIYSNYNINSAQRDTAMANAQLHEGYYVVDRRNTFKPFVFEQMMRFRPGDLYNRTDHNITLSRLINLGTFKFVKNRFEVLPDSFQLNTYYYLTPLPKKSLSAEVGGLTKSNNVTGSEITLRWQNRNTFRGAELLTVSAYGGFEVQYSGQYSGFNTYRYGSEVNLTFPRFLIPILKFNTKGSFVPRTNFQLGYDILQRQKLYTINSYRGQIGYIWKESATKEHTLNPFTVNYVQSIDVQDTFFRAISKNPLLQRVIEKQFIIGSYYNFNYNELISGAKNEGGWYFNGLVDLSGNILGLVTGASAKNGKQVDLFGSPFSQYVKTEFDTRRYFKIGSKSQWANRLIVGIGYPYGNSTVLPFSKQFFAGGSNSLRGFRSRSVGPGTYNGARKADELGFFPDITGDLKLEINSEYRTNLFSIFDGALFVDAGNIWLANRSSDTAQTGAKFSKNFYKELAVDAGFGLRIDLSILMLRLDLAIPLRKPYLPVGNRWVFDEIDFTSSTWRKNNIIWNLAIGLPF